MSQIHSVVLKFTGPLLWDGGMEKVHVELTVGPITFGPEIKNGSSVKDGLLERSGAGQSR